jgi:6-pyruvoyltetrahydropterin/6-carboxytetrahydropterin synthase
MGGWIDQHWDHGMVVWEADDLACKAARMIPGQKTYLLPTNPTAENMAAFLLLDIAPGEMANTGVEIHKVVLWETENCFAEASL